MRFREIGCKWTGRKRPAGPDAQEWPKPAKPASNCIFRHWNEYNQLAKTSASPATGEILFTATRDDWNPEHRQARVVDECGREELRTSPKQPTKSMCRIYLYGVLADVLQRPSWPPLYGPEAAEPAVAPRCVSVQSIRRQQRHLRGGKKHRFSSGTRLITEQRNRQRRQRLVSGCSAGFLFIGIFHRRHGSDGDRTDHLYKQVTGGTDLVRLKSCKKWHGSARVGSTIRRQILDGVFSAAGRCGRSSGLFIRIPAQKSSRWYRLYTTYRVCPVRALTHRGVFPDLPVGLR